MTVLLTDRAGEIIDTKDTTDTKQPGNNGKEKVDLEYAGLYHHQQAIHTTTKSESGVFSKVAPSSTSGIILLLIYIILDANKAVTVYWSYSAREPQERYSAGSIVMAENILSLTVSMVLSLSLLGGKKCLSMWSQSYFLRLVPSALCFTIARILGMRALEYIDAGTLKVMSQAVLPTNAILSSLILGTRYTKWQWQCVVLIFLTTTAFYEMRVSEDRRLYSISRGLPLFIPTLIFTSIGAVYSEKCIKAGGSMPFYYQKAMLSLASCLCVAVFAGSASFTRPPKAVSPLNNPFHNWDTRTVLALLSWSLSSWTAGIVVKRLSVVIKNTAQCVAILITYFTTSIFILNDTPSLTAILLACAVLQSSVMYFSSVLMK